MSDNESKDAYPSTFELDEFNRDRALSLKADELENIDQQFDEAPVWENRFVDVIEQMRTIPYVMLGHFEFINVNWIEDNVEDNLTVTDTMTVETDDKPTNHWDMVKRMIFSKVSKSFKNERASSKDGRRKNLKRRRKSSISNFVGQQIVDQFNSVYGYFKGFISKDQPRRKGRKNRPVKDRKKILSVFESAKKSIRNQIDRNRLLKRFKKKPKKKRKHSNANSKFALNKKDEIVLNDENSVSQKGKRLLSLRNMSKFSKRMLGKRKEFIIDLTELATSKRFYKLNMIMTKDDGPFMTDYRFLLGIDFWSSFCGVEKYQLIFVCPSNFWIKEMNSLQTKGLKESHKSKSKGEYSRLSEFKQFLKGTDKPARAPQRVVSSEEKFRLIPYPKLFNPNTDLKKTFHSNTIQDQIDKKLKRIYQALVYIIGGKYPLIRPVGFEEAYEDTLLWVLDTYQAKTRFIALLNNQIKSEIN